MREALAAWQHEFAGFLLQESMEPAPALKTLLGLDHDDHTLAARRMEAGLCVYRNNVIHSLMQALAMQFPVIRKLVGAEFFAALARDYVRQVPPAEPVLTFYGDQFAAFIAGHPACHALPYLSDVATLELQCQRALHAADASVLDVQELAAIAPQQLAAAQFVLQPSACLLTSSYPIDQIWAANLEDSETEIRLEPYRLHQLLVYRRELHVEVVALASEAYALLLQLQRGTCLGEACAYVQQHDALEDTDLAALFAYLLGLEVFSHFALQKDEEPQCN